DLRLAGLREDDRVLTKDAAERDRLFAVHAVNQPGRLAPDALGLGLRADAWLDPVAAENQEIAKHEVPLLVDPAGQEHRTGIVRRENREARSEQRRERSEVLRDLAVERHPDVTGLRGQLVDRREVRAEEGLVHA